MANAEYSLPADVSIKSIDSIHKALSEQLSILSTDSSIHINCANVERMTSTGVQLLISLAKNCKENKIKVYLSNPSQALNDAFDEFTLELSSFF